MLDKRVQQLSEENRSLLDEKQKLERLKRLLESNLETAKSDLLARDSLLNKMKQVRKASCVTNLDDSFTH